MAIPASRFSDQVRRARSNAITPVCIPTNRAVHRPPTVAMARSTATRDAILTSRMKASFSARPIILAAPATVCATASADGKMTHALFRRHAATANGMRAKTAIRACSCPMRNRARGRWGLDRQGRCYALSTQSPACGNNKTENGTNGTARYHEVCDGTDLNGKTCAKLLGSEYTGTLGCLSNCTGYDYTNCRLK